MNKIKLKYFGLRSLLVIFVMSLWGCSQVASKVSQKDAEEFVSNATYAKDPRTGLFFAVIGSRRFGSLHQEGMSFTWVPAAEAEKYLKIEK
jgi:hypothetical protein